MMGQGKEADTTSQPPPQATAPNSPAVMCSMLCCAVLWCVVLCPLGTQIPAPGISWIFEKPGSTDFIGRAILGCILGFLVPWALQSPDRIVQLLYTR